MSHRCVRLAALLTLLVALPAHAVYNQQVVIVGGPQLASAQINFKTSDGQTVPVETKQDGERRVGVIVFSGDSGSAGTLTLTAPGAQSRAYSLPKVSSGDVVHIDTATGAVSVEKAPRTASTPNAEPRSVGTLSGFYGWGNVQVPQIGSASLLGSADGDRFLAQTDEDIGVDGYGLQFTLPLGGLRSQFMWAHYSGDDDDRTESILSPGSGVTNNIGFQQSSDTYGSGFAGGTTPLVTFGALDVDGDKFGGSFSWPCRHIEHVTGTLGIYYGTTDLEQKQFDTFTTAPVSTERKAKVSQDSWFLTLGGDYVYPFNDRIRAALSLGAIAQYYDADLKSTQRINFFTNAPEVLESKDDDDDIAFGAYFSAALPIQFGKFTLTPVWVVETGTVTAQVDYPNSGTAIAAGDHVQLDNDTTTNWIATLGLSYTF